MNSMKMYSNFLMAGVLGLTLAFSTAPFAESMAATNNVDAVPGQPVDLTYAAEKAIPAVVHIRYVQNSKTKTVKVQSSPFDDFFNDFFGNPYGDGGTQERKIQTPKREATGSGVIISPDGYIVTNNHVVDGADELTVTLNDNREFSAKIVGTDKTTDLALIKVDAKNLPTLPIGDSEKLKVGEWVIAVGNPFNFNSTVTAGIVSAKARSLYANGVESFIQTDAAINPGNSGGALVNAQGELVGINTAIVSQTGSYSGYSFAVPANIVKKVVGDLIDFGSVKRAVLGIQMIDLTEALAKKLEYESVDDMSKKLKLSSLEGVYIGEVAKGGSADKAGIKVGDILLSVDGEAVKNGAAVQVKVNSYHPGDKVPVTVMRDGKTKTFDVVFQGSSSETGTVVADGEIAFYGATLKEADAETLARFSLKKGVLVSSVGTGKMLEAGAAEGMVITYVNDKPVSKPQDVIDIAKTSTRSVYIEGVSANGRKVFFGFGKD